MGGPEQKVVSVRLVCVRVGLSGSGYRAQPEFNADAAKFTESLLRLKENQGNLGFGLTLVYVRDLKGCLSSHNSLYRICGELARNLRTRRKRREK